MRPLEADDPRSVGGYALLGRLGGGGTGGVFLGRSAVGRIAAVTVLHAESAADPEFRRRFAREVEAARRVDARFTAAVLDADPYAPRPWLVAEYITGVSLASAVAAGGPLPVEVLRALLAGGARALEALHAVGLTHRGLGPSNILLADDGPRIVGFGTARAQAQLRPAGAGQTADALGYLAPEQVRGDAAGPYTDVYALAATLVHAATGRGPYADGHGDGDPAALLARIGHQAPDLRGVPEELRPTLAACLAADPARRPTVARLRAEFPVPEAVRERRWLPDGLGTPSASPPARTDRTAPLGDPPPPAPAYAPSDHHAPYPPNAPSHQHAPYPPHAAYPAASVPPGAPPPPAGTPVPPARRGSSRRALLAAVVGGGAAVAVGGGLVLWQRSDGGGGPGPWGARDGEPSWSPGPSEEAPPSPAPGTGSGGAGGGPGAATSSGLPTDGKLPAIVYGAGFGQRPTVAAATGPAPTRLLVATPVRGRGRTATRGATLSVQYVMQIWGRSDVVDSSYQRGKPFDFMLGVGHVIKGWDEALLGKRVGSRVQFAVPPEKGYGAKGMPSAGVTGTDTLLYVVDIVAVRTAGGSR